MWCGVERVEAECRSSTDRDRSDYRHPAVSRCLDSECRSLATGSLLGGARAREGSYLKQGCHLQPSRRESTVYGDQTQATAPLGRHLLRPGEGKVCEAVAKHTPRTAGARARADAHCSKRKRPQTDSDALSCEAKRGGPGARTCSCMCMPVSFCSALGYG